jgi:gentisate 1,2-dioxygenase
MKTVEFILQMIPADTATDLQRHVHESVHYVSDGSGWSEIGDQVVEWKKGDFVFTPPWIWHRHYANSQDVHMIIIENSRMLNTLDAGRRESRGSVSFADEFGAKDR